MTSLEVQQITVTGPIKDTQTLDPILKTINPLLPKPPFRMIFNGPSGSGKSRLAKYLLLRHYTGIFDKVYLFCPTFYEDQTLRDLVQYEEYTVEEKIPGDGPGGWAYDKKTKKPIIEKVTKRRVWEESPLTEDDVITEADPQLLQAILEEKWKESAKAYNEDPSGYRALFIFDDLSIELSKSTILGNYFTKGRKVGASIIVMSNKYKTYPPVIRANTTAFAFFKPTTAQEQKDILTDIGGALSAETQRALFKRVYKGPGDFLFYEPAAPEEKRYRRNLDTFIKISET